MIAQNTAFAWLPTSTDKSENSRLKRPWSEGIVGWTNAQTAIPADAAAPSKEMRTVH